MKSSSPIKQTRSLGMALKALALSALAATALSTPASAQQLMVGGPDSLIRSTIPVTEDFNVVGACGGVVQSMVASEDKTFIGDQSGVIYVHDAADGVNYAFNAGNDATALATDSQYLYVGGSDGSVERYTLSSYSLLDVWTAPAGLRALTAYAGRLYAAGDNGQVVSTFLFGPPTGTFTLFADVGMPITAICVDQSALLLGSATGEIKRLRIADQLVTANFTVGTNVAALEVSLSQLLVVGSEGIVRRVDPLDGAMFQSLSVGSSVRGIAITNGIAPAFTYCYGIQCPCGNDDSNAGCANSTGRGARMAAAGTTSVSADDLTLFMTSAPANTTTIVFMGADSVTSPTLGDGILCIGGPGGLQRFAVQQTDSFGTLVLNDLRQTAETQFGSTFQITVGSNWRFQAWFRDTTGPCGSFSNSTNSAEVGFTP